MEPSSTSKRLDQPPLVVVTGAGRGIGYALSLALARDHGVEVLAVSRDLGAWNKAGIPLQVKPLQADASTEAGRAAIIEAVGPRPLFALVNNAGSLLKRSLGEWAEVDLAMHYAVNVVAPVLLTQSLMLALGRSAAAHVVNIGSMGGFQGSAKFPGLIGYSSSKAALACATECMAEELTGTAVRCNCLCLGAVDTAMLREAFPGYTANVQQDEMGSFIAEFVMNGYKLLNGKVLPIALSTP